MSEQSMYFLAAIIGMFVGLAGWLSKRDSKNMADAEWRGAINSKLDAILGIAPEVDALGRKVEDHSIAIAKLEDKAKSAHERLDRHKLYCERQMERHEKLSRGVED